MLKFMHMVVLYAICKAARPLTQREMYDPDTHEGLINGMITMWNLPGIYPTRYLSSNWALLGYINDLRDENLLSKKGSYRPTKLGCTVIEEIGDDPMAWPIEFDVCDSGVQPQTAEYVPTDMRHR